MTREQVILLKMVKQALSAEAADVYKAHEEEHLEIINRIKELQYAIAKTQTIVGKLVESAEAVEVVRCKDCKDSRVYGKTTQWLACESVMEGQATDPDGYCYLGERKEP